MLVAAIALAPHPARADARADSLANAAGVQVIGSAPPAATPRAPADTTRRKPWTAQPRIVMARSLVVPGWGQVYNHAWLKAVLVAGGEGLLMSRIVQDQRKLDDLLRQLDLVRADTLPPARVREGVLVNEYNDRLDQRLARQWMLGAVVAYALVDAYVDAHFRGFDLEFKRDPALPAGPPPAGAPSGGGSGGVRLDLRWRF